MCLALHIVEEMIEDGLTWAEGGLSKERETL
jgi:hypothetical protein